MNLSQFSKINNLTKEEYKNLKDNIKATAQSIYTQLEEDRGVYKPITNIFQEGLTTDLHYFIIAELKKLGVEFIADNTQYRK